MSHTIFGICLFLKMIPYYLKFTCEYSVFPVAHSLCHKSLCTAVWHLMLAFTVGPPSTSHRSRVGQVSVPRLPHSNNEEFTHFRKPKPLSNALRCWVVFPGLELQSGFLVLPPLIIALPFESHKKRYLSPPAHENLLNNLWLRS